MGSDKGEVQMPVYLKKLVFNPTLTDSLLRNKRASHHCHPDNYSSRMLTISFNFLTTGVVQVENHLRLN